MHHERVRKGGAEEDGEMGADGVNVDEKSRSKSAAAM
jgi:hypothetical protein